MFPNRNGFKRGGALSPLLLNYSVDCAVRRVQVREEDLKLNGIHQVVVYGEDVNKFGGNLHTMNKNTNTLVVAKKEFFFL
jgi:hypothetical protein